MIETEPGDVVAFGGHLMNCAQGGLPRLTWTIDYLPWPGLAAQDQLALGKDLSSTTLSTTMRATTGSAGRSGANGRPGPPGVSPGQ